MTLKNIFTAILTSSGSCRYVNMWLLVLAILVSSSLCQMQVITQLGSDLLGTPNERAGSSVSTSSDGNVIAIGSPWYSSPFYTDGRVRIFAYNLSSWSQRGSDILGPGSNSYCGTSLSLSSDGNVIAVGFGYSNVRVFAFNVSVSDWSQQGSDITQGSSYDDVTSLSSDGKVVAMGSPEFSLSLYTREGRVRVFDFIGESWTQRGSDIEGTQSNEKCGFSASLSSDGNIVAIGSPGFDTTKTDTGRVRVFAYSGNSWSQRGSDILGTQRFEQSGYSVSLNSDGSVVAVGSISGILRVFAYTDTSWSQKGSFSPLVGGFPVAISRDGLSLIVMNKVFSWGGSGKWNQVGSDIPGDTAFSAVAINSDGTKVIIGDLEFNSLSGRARVFSVNSLIASPSMTPTATLSMTPTLAVTNFPTHSSVVSQETIIERDSQTTSLLMLVIVVFAVALFISFCLIAILFCRLSNNFNSRKVGSSPTKEEV